MVQHGEAEVSILSQNSEIMERAFHAIVKLSHK